MPFTGSAPSASSTSRVWPLNQNGAPAASLTPAIFVPAGSGLMNGGGLAPFVGKVTVWKPLIVHLTLSPTWTVTVLRKKALTSPSCGVPVTLPGGPAVTVRVAPWAAAAGTSAVAATAATAIPRILLFQVESS